VAAAVNLRLETVKGVAKRGVAGWPARHDLSEFWTQKAGVGSRKEEGNAQTRRGNVIAMAFRDALDQAVQTETAQVVGHASHGVLGWVETQQLSQQGSHFPTSETP